MSLLCSKAAKTEIPLRAGDLGKMVELTNSPRQKGREGYKIILEGPFHTFLVLNILGLKHNHTSERFPLSTPNSHYTSRLHNPFALTWTPKQDNTHNPTLSGPLCNPHALFYKTHNTKQKRIGFLLTTFNKQDIYYPHLRTLGIHTETTGTKWTNQILPSETHFTPTILDEKFHITNSATNFHIENLFTDYTNAVTASGTQFHRHSKIYKNRPKSSTCSINMSNTSISQHSTKSTPRRKSQTTNDVPMTRSPSPQLSTEITSPVQPHKRQALQMDSPNQMPTYEPTLILHANTTADADSLRILLNNQGIDFENITEAQIDSEKVYEITFYSELHRTIAREHPFLSQSQYGESVIKDDEHQDIVLLNCPPNRTPDEILHIVLGINDSFKTRSNTRNPLSPFKHRSTVTVMDVPSRLRNSLLDRQIRRDGDSVIFLTTTTNFPRHSATLRFLPQGTTESSLHLTFRNYQLNPSYWYIPETKLSGRKLDHAYVHFHTLEHLEHAINTKMKINGHPVLWLSLDDKMCQFCRTLTKKHKPSCPKLNKKTTSQKTPKKPKTIPTTGNETIKNKT